VQIGELLEAEGAVGIGLMVAVVTTAALGQPRTVTVTEYVPASAAVVTGIDGFCDEETNPFGPVQEYVAPATLEELRSSCDPSQIGELFDAVGGVGVGFTTTVVVPAEELVHPRTVTFTEYVPAAASVTPAIVGF
jgi:hypothetical protein